MKTFEQRAERVLEIAYRGLHHCGEIHKTKQAWETSHYGELSTFDGDILTRLVISAHDNCIRLTIKSSGPRMVKIVLHNRTCRIGDFYERHPTIDDQIIHFRQNHPATEVER